MTLPDLSALLWLFVLPLMGLNTILQLKDRLADRRTKRKHQDLQAHMRVHAKKP